ncbi:MAG: tRNA (adenosine(37)-N6)-dimethylallyltransferase MiaA [Gemmatimonadetes bacterium]|nr:tRNA (adenosine(37)-N6)-dimethylallyltransferase MiaA [Gemmatimonadota bacterium]
MIRKVDATPAFLAVVGCTAAGKSALAMRVAREVDGEIVAMDSRQIYLGMDIGTAKATPEERVLVPHHGLDIRKPGERYGAGEFARDARRWIAEIRGRERVAILVGGTGFYLRALTDPPFAEPPLEDAGRSALEAALAAMPVAEVRRWSRALDPGRTGPGSDDGGRQRMTRRITVAFLTGRSLSWWHAHRPSDGLGLRGAVFLVRVPREVLSSRIERRVDAMMRAGLPGEVEGLLEAGYRPGDAGMNAVGYRELASHLAGEISLDEAVETIVRATRQYAKRQRTWFRHQLDGGAIVVDGTARLEEQAEVVVRHWRVAAGAEATAR